MIEDYIKLFNIRSQNVAKAAESRKGGRKGKKKRGVPRSMNINLAKGKDSTGKESVNLIESNLEAEKNKFMTNPPIDAGLDLLEQLISPIRDDKEYGKIYLLNGI